MTLNRYNIRMLFVPQGKLISSTKYSQTWYINKININNAPKFIEEATQNGNKTRYKRVRHQNSAAASQLFIIFFKIPTFINNYPGNRGYLIQLPSVSIKKNVNAHPLRKRKIYFSLSFLYNFISSTWPFFFSSDYNKKEIIFRRIST